MYRIKTYNELLESAKIPQLPERLMIYNMSGNRYIEVVRFNRIVGNRYDIDYSYTNIDYIENETISAKKLVVKIYNMLKDSDLMVSLNYKNLLINVFYNDREWFLSNEPEIIRDYYKKKKRKDFNL